MSDPEQKNPLSLSPAGPGPGRDAPPTSPEEAGSSIFYGVSQGSRRRGNYLKAQKDWLPEIS